ncbi:TPA: replication initiator protein A [Streptococcus pneumoniae]
MDFDYFYNRDTERFRFYMLPKILVTEDLYKNLSSDAKILYACLLERSSLSLKNDWIDEQGRVYIVFTVEEIMKMLNKSNKTAVKILNELDANTKGIGLIERKRQGLGKPNIIYVKDFMSVFRSECKNYTSEVKNLHSGNVEITLQEVKNLHSSNTNINNTDYSNTDFGKGQTGLGTFQNVFLTEKETKELKEILGYQFDNYIQRLSAYIQSTGKTYKDHKATILSWFYKDQGTKKADKPSNIPTWAEYDKGEHL